MQERKHHEALAASRDLPPPGRAVRPVRQVNATFKTLFEQRITKLLYSTATPVNVVGFFQDPHFFE